MPATSRAAKIRDHSCARLCGICACVLPVFFDCHLRVTSPSFQCLPRCSLNVVSEKRISQTLGDCKDALAFQKEKRTLPFQHKTTKLMGRCQNANPKKGETDTPNLLITRRVVLCVLTFSRINYVSQRCYRGCTYGAQIRILMCSSEIVHTSNEILTIT